MSSPTPLRLFAPLCLLALGCYEHHRGEVPDLGSDVDAGPLETDASVAPDAGPDVGVDGGGGTPMDAGPPDVGFVDDAGAPDEGPPCVPEPERCGDSVDQDCDGRTDEIVERASCGLGVCANEAVSCDAASPAVCVPLPAGEELCADGLDQDCDGLTDEIVERVSCGLGTCSNEAVSCDAASPADCVPLPAREELCADGLDQDCDGRTDEIVEDVTCGVGACTNEARSCDLANPAMCVPRPPQEEVCNGIDDDCDGFIDLIDRGDDGVPDCLNIVLLGASGSQDAQSFSRWIRDNGAASNRILTRVSERLTAESIANADVLILDQLPRSYSAEEAAVLASWVQDGGGLMALTGHYNSAPTVDRANSLVAQFGLSYVFRLPVINSTVTMVTDHPAVARVEDVPVIGGFEVLAAPGASIVGVDDAGNDVIGVTEFGAGRVYLFADEWVVFDAQWNMREAALRVFWSAALRWLGHSRSD